MATIVTRAGKGSPLTNTEVDANFTNLNTDKAELSGAAFTGAITTNSTVDGRDLATDGTKLDTVETNADVTAAAGALMDSELTSIASVKALDQGVATTDSPTFAAATFTGVVTANAGVVVDNFTLDGTTLALSSGNMILDSAGDISLDADDGKIRLRDSGTQEFIVDMSVADVTTLRASLSNSDMKFDGNDGGTNITALTLDMSNAGRAFFNVGASFSGDVAMGDNNKTKYGAGEDLILYSDGTNGEIEAPNGTLTLDVAGDIILNADGGDWLFNDGAVTLGSLQNDGSNNLIVMSNTNDKDIKFLGIDNNNTITALQLDMSAAGAATFNSTIAAGAVTLTVSDTSDILTLISTDGGTGFGPNVSLYRNSSSPADGDVLGAIDFDGRNDNSQDVQYAQIVAQAFDVSDGTEDATLYLQTMVAGTTRERLSLHPAEAIFNDAGIDLDFRVESDAQTHALFVNGATNTVAFGSSDPQTAYSFIGAGGIYLGNGNQPTGDFMSIDAEGGSGGTQMTFYRYDSSINNYQNRFTIGGELAETVANESGLDHDFRVESDGASHALFVEGSSNYVGLNTSAPTQPLSLGTRTGANLNYIDGTTNSAATDTGIFVSGSTTNDQSTKLGMLLANNENNNSARSPIIGFSALSASNNYNHMYAAINGRKIGSGADTNWNHGQIEFCTSSGIGPNVRMILDYNGGLITKPNTGGHTVFNEDSIDADFRVESNTISNALFVDGATGGVQFGESGSNPYNGLTTAHNIKGSSEQAGAAATGIYNSSGTANCPALNVLNRDSSTDTTNRFMQFYANVTSSGGTAMGGIVGNGASNVQFAALSDVREKQNIEALTNSLDKITSLNPVEFDWIASGEHCKAGFIAQEVEEVFPEFVVENMASEGQEERKGLTGGMTGGIVAHLVKAIQEQQTLIETLTTRIAALEE